MKDRPNVLMITVDQLGRNHMEIGGDAVSNMPTVRYLAAQGVQFDNCYSSCPVCIPARRSLMTGTYPQTHGDRVYNDRLPMPSSVTLAQAFRDQGYQACAVGKLHVFPQRNRIGFDDVLLMEEGRYEFGETDDYQIWLGEQGFAGQEFMHGMGNNTYHTRTWHLPEYTHPTNWITRMMCSAIKRRDPCRPGFFHASYVFPHPPLVPLREYLEQYGDVTLPEPASGEWQREAAVLEDMREDARQYNEREKTAARKAYYAACTHIDHQLRLIIGTLRECGMTDNTVILFTADHGDMLFDHNMVGKRCFYEASANIPLFAAGNIVTERGKKGVTDHRLCSLEDVMPSLLELCGLNIPQSVEGRSLFGSGPEWKYLYGEVSEGRRATRMVRSRDFKLIYYPCGNYLQLFDMVNDRRELRNLAGQPRYERVQEELTNELIRRLYGTDTGWVEDGRLKGMEWTPPPVREDFGLNNHRGFHWPAPG